MYWYCKLLIPLDFYRKLEVNYSKKLLTVAGIACGEFTVSFFCLILREISDCIIFHYSHIQSIYFLRSVQSFALSASTQLSSLCCTDFLSSVELRRRNAAIVPPIFEVNSRFAFLFYFFPFCLLFYWVSLMLAIKHC